VVLELQVKAMLVVVVMVQAGLVILQLVAVAELRLLVRTVHIIVLEALVALVLTHFQLGQLLHQQVRLVTMLAVVLAVLLGRLAAHPHQVELAVVAMVAVTLELAGQELQILEEELAVAEKTEAVRVLLAVLES
jgi:hypothetical protein